MLVKHDISSPEKYFAKDNPLKGSEGYKQALSVVFTAFPDIYVEIEHMVTENDLIVAFLNFVGTHKGEFRGMLPTNNPVNIRSADLYGRNLYLIS